jgi:hypothetical protein
MDLVLFGGENFYIMTKIREKKMKTIFFTP